MKPTQFGFSLIELVVVIVVTGVLAGGLVVFFKPAMEAYVSAGQRAALSDMADSAARRMSRDVRLAVPNSIRQPGNQCFELVPTASGGKFRSAADTASTAGLSQELDVAVPGQKFDVFAPLSPPTAGDWLIIGNQDADSLYNGSNLNVITSVDAPPASNQAGAVIATHRITLGAAAKVPPGYPGASYVTVAAGQGPVMYVCADIGVDSRGTGTGVLYRLAGYGFNNPLKTCPVPVPNTPVVATKLSGCALDFDPNPGSVQGSGYMRILLQLSEQNETINLLYGAHADNLP